MSPTESLSPVERWLLDMHRRHGRRGFVVAVAGGSIALSMGLTGPLMLVISTAAEEFVIGMLISVLVPGVVAPAVALSLSRLLTVIDDTSRELHHLARTDPLTGVLNRRAFAADAASAIASQPDSVAVMVDVDSFKAVNDRFGHGTGDAVLVGLADNLRRAVGHDAVIGRFGGDEFALVVATVAGRDSETLLAQACDLSGIVEGLSASFGTSAAAGRPLDEVLAEADVDMYRRKRAAADSPIPPESTDGAHVRATARS